MSSSNRFLIMRKANNAAVAKAKTQTPWTVAEVENKFVEKLQEKVELNKRNVKKLFVKYDTNGDGELDLGEMAEMIGVFLNGIPRSIIQQLVKCYDVDGDGVINLEEFQSMLMSRQHSDKSKWVTCNYLTSAKEKMDVTSNDAENWHQDENVSGQDHYSEQATSEYSEQMVGGSRSMTSRSSDRFFYEEPRPSSAAIRKEAKRTQYMTKSLLQSIHSSLLAKARILVRTGKVLKRDRLSVKQSQLLEDLGEEILNREFGPYVRKSKQDGSVSVRFENFKRIVMKFSPDGAAVPSDDILQNLFFSCCRNENEDMADPSILCDMVFDKGGSIINKFGFAQNTDPVSHTNRPGVGKGPIYVGEDFTLQMSDIPLRMRTKQCRTALAVPSNFHTDIAKISAQPPNYELQRSHIFGMNINLMSGNSMVTICENVVLYAAAAVLVVHDIANNKQIFLDGCTDDITCFGLSKCGNFAAAGQTGKESMVCIWQIDDDSLDIAEPTQSARPMITIGLGFFDRAVCALCFSPDSKYICAVGCDDHHGMGIWDISTGRIMVDGACANGDPDILRAIIWSPTQGHNSFVTKDHAGLSDLICTAGARHLKFWSFRRPNRSIPASLIGRSGRLSKEIKSHAKVYSCAAFSEEERGTAGHESFDTYIGADDGNLYLYRECVCVGAVKACPGGISSMSVVGDFLFCGGAKFNLAIFNASNLKPVRTIVVSEADPNKAPSGVKAASRLPVEGFRAKTTTSDIVQSAPKTTRHIVQQKNQWSGPSQKQKHESVPVPDGKNANSNILGIAVMLSGQGQDSTSKQMSLNGGKVVVATGFGKAYQVILNLSDTVVPCFNYHWAPTWAVISCVPSRGQPCLVSGGDDRILCLWDVNSRAFITRTKMLAPVRCVDAAEKILAVGMVAGVFAIYHIRATRSLNSVYAFDRAQASMDYEIIFLASRRDVQHDISDIKFSPNQRMLATGSHEGYIDLYSFSAQGESTPNPTVDLTPLRRMKGHNSYVTHLDWSIDNKLLQSTCGAYEILYWSAADGTQLLSKDDNTEADSEWATLTCPFGFNVMGIWPHYSDGTDVNAVDVNPNAGLVATGDDFGKLKIFNYPCVSKDAPFSEGSGHSSHVMNVRFVRGSRCITTAGGCDTTIFLWDVKKKKSAIARAFR